MGLDNYTWSSEAIYSYKIQSDTAWTTIKENELTLGRLPYGNQILEIRALLPNGQFANTILDIPIEVIRPFYLTIWFVLLCISVVAGIFYAIYRYQILQYQKRQEMRTRIASDLHDDVGSLLSRLAMQAEMIKYVSKERADAIVDEIVNTSRSSIDTMRDLIWAIDARNDTQADIFLRMEEQLEETLAPAGIDYSMNTNRVTNKQPLPPEDRQNIFFIFKEAINNSVKHSNAEAILVNITYSKNLFRLDIKERLPEDAAVDASSGKLTSKKSGHGMQNMEMRAKRIGAELVVNTENGYHIRVNKYL